jgi:hypothetical protein
VTCRTCCDEINRWSDTKPISSFSFAYGSGAAYDVSLPGIRDARRARYETWRRLVNRQIAMVRAACLAECHEEVQDSPAVELAEVDPSLL